ncbi:MAG: prenyltransferase/squalene oxidase repeat-containing protein [Planctomycetota bacterium]
MRILCAVWVAAAVAAEGDPPQPAVDAAVGRGVAWLRREQKPSGVFGAGPGETALALLALRDSGVPAQDKGCLRAAAYLERSLPDGTVYGAALGVLALLAQDLREHRPKIETLVRHLVRGQCRNGQWTYAYRATARKKAGDNSNTQMAALALGAARVRRLRVPSATFERLSAFLKASQNEDGGFGYAPRQRARSYGSMTAGGAMALALCAGTSRPAAQPEVERALAWLGRGFDPARNRDAARAFGQKKGKRSDAFWKHYWLWSVERAGAACGVRLLGAHDWYAEGAHHLLAEQRADGSWRDPERSLLATSFALLFLRRSTRIVLTPRPGDVTSTPGKR